MNPDEMSKRWHRLTNNQRLYLVNNVVPYGQQGRQPHFIKAGRALARHGLLGTDNGRALARWAIERGYAEHTKAGWSFRSPIAPRRYRTIDPARLAELAAEGLHASAVAQELGVTRQAVDYATKRGGIELARKPKKVPAEKPPRVLRPRRLVFCVSDGESAAIETAAKDRGMTVSAYLREQLSAATPDRSGPPAPRP